MLHPLTLALTPSLTLTPTLTLTLILYVGVPALVLIGQLFFTFSRDAFVGTARPNPYPSHSPATPSSVQLPLTLTLHLLPRRLRRYSPP